MKIAILGSAPSSINLAPFSDPSFRIWACSPGTYSILPRCDAFFELHRWEPGQIGKPHTQKQWFSPEYVAWMGKQCRVWMYDAVPEIPGSARLPVEDLEAKYGTYFFTSSIAWMLACAIEDVLEEREQRRAAGLDPVQDVIGLFGVDMAATEEWGYQRAGCQHFCLLAADLGIEIVVPPESDLLRPSPRYGIDESEHWMIKLTARKGELTSRLYGARQQVANFTREVAFLEGALDDMDYMMKTWCGEREGKGVSFDIMAKSPDLQRAVLEVVQSEAGKVAIVAGQGDAPMTATEIMQRDQPGRKVVQIA
jgi:hypothetical protein